VADIDRRMPGFWREDRLLSFFLGFLVLMTIVVPMHCVKCPHSLDCTISTVFTIEHGS